jgi:hypothetical protein
VIADGNAGAFAGMAAVHHGAGMGTGLSNIGMDTINGIKRFISDANILSVNPSVHNIIISSSCTSV